MNIRLFLGVLAVVLCGASAGVLSLDTFESLAESHEHWEHIVRRRSIAALFEAHDQEDETSHIVDIQEYYRKSLDQGWEDNEGELMRLLKLLERVEERKLVSDEEKASIQDETEHILEIQVDSKPIKGRYIVMLQKSADDYTLDRTMEVLEKANRESNQRVRASDMVPLRHVGKGFVGTLNRKTLALLQRHPLVAHIEEDMALRRSQITVPGKKEASSNAECTGEGCAVVAETKPTWNLDRLDQHTPQLNGVYSPEGTGKNVDIVIIDTGVRATHQELEGRVKYAGFDAVDALTGTHNQGRDCNGHGTHCAATAAGKTLGVAREATIVNLRALNCKGSGAVSGIVQGIDKLVKAHKESNSGNPMVISQSLGVKVSPSLNAAVVEATNAGIVCVGAAGNQGENSCNHSPASAKVGIAVGATDQNDEVSIFSNTGSCTDIMAPGMQIKSASKDCDTCTKTMSGTSMAAPHAAGYAAILMSLHPQLNAVQVKERMMNVATQGRVKMSAIISSRSYSQETPNRLLYVPTPEARDSDIGNLDLAGATSFKWGTPK